jgi:hypothetical protein
MKLAYVMLASLLLVGASANAATYSFITDYYGYSWETASDGGPPRAPLAAGNIWQMVGIVDGVQPPLTADLVNNELTFTLMNLSQSGDASAVAAGTDARRGPWIMYQVTYVDGATFNLYLDSSKNHDWGTNPPNATAPSTFQDGTPYLTASTRNMNVLITEYTSTGDEIGTFETDLTFNGGSHWSEIGNGTSGYSFAGISKRPEASVPTGYKERVDGQQFITPVQPATWGAIKGLYRH